MRQKQSAARGAEFVKTTRHRQAREVNGRQRDQKSHSQSGNHRPQPGDRAVYSRIWPTHRGKKKDEYRADYRHENSGEVEIAGVSQLQIHTTY